MTDFCSFQQAEQLLEDEITNRQTMLISTDQCKYESPSAEQEAKECLEDEIEHFIMALKRLKAQSYCDRCETHLLDLHEAFRVSLTYCSGMLPFTNLKVARVLIRVVCANCLRPPMVRHTCSFESTIGGSGIEMADEAFRSQDRKWATRKEVDQALKSLTPEQWRTLQKRAAYRVQDLGRASHGRTGEDLFGDAIRSTVERTQGTGKGRRWNKRVDFVTHLLGAMRSIADHWRKSRSREQETYLESEVVRCDEEGREFSPLDIVSADPSVLASAPWHSRPAPMPDESLIAKEKLGRIFNIPKNDKEARVLLGWSEGMETVEVMQEYELTLQQYKSARKKLRLRLSTGRNGAGEGKEHFFSSRLRHALARPRMTNINASSKSVLVVHYDKILLELLALKLKQAGYTVRTACEAEEGLRLYEHCGSFKVVLINYDLPKKDGVKVAMGILERNPSQGMIITAFDYASEEEVPRPKELMHIPILIDPLKVELRRSLERVQDSSASASPLSEEPKETHIDQAVLEGAPECGNETTMAVKAEQPDRAVADEKQLSAEAS